MEAGAAEFAGQIPLILKANNPDNSGRGERPQPGAHRAGGRCAAARLRAPSGTRSIRARLSATDVQEICEFGARPRTMASPWSSGPIPAARASEGRRDRGGRVAYAAQIAASSATTSSRQAAERSHRARRGPQGVREGADLHRVRSPSASRHVVQSAFDGRRIVIFSGGEDGHHRGRPPRPTARSPRAAASHDHGRSRSSAKHDEAVKLLQDVMEIRSHDQAGPTQASIADERES